MNPHAVAVVEEPVHLMQVSRNGQYVAPALQQVEQLLSVVCMS